MSVALLLAFAVAGSLVKIVGGLIYGSRALLIDAFTSIANLVALGGTVYYYKVSVRPPDKDHHFGHLRLGYGGTLVTLTVYAFVGGLAVSRLLSFEAYSVEVEAPIAAVVGFGLYLVTVVLAGRMGGFFRAYAGFTGSELLEGTVVIASSLAGALYSYLVDYVGAVIITLYLFRELYENTRRVISELSDVAPSPHLLEEIREMIEREGFTVKRIRIRHVYGGTYQGDVVIASDPHRRVVEVHEAIDKIQDEIFRRHGVEIVIHVEPTEF